MDVVITILRFLPVVAFAAWCLWGVDWRRAWPILAVCGWVPLVLIGIMTGVVWAFVFPSAALVSGIGKLPTGLYTIDLASGNENDLTGIKCILDREDKAAEEKAGNLKEGDTVTIAGRCEGKAIGQFLHMKYCYFPK